MKLSTKFKKNYLERNQSHLKKIADLKWLWIRSSTEFLGLFSLGAYVLPWAICEESKPLGYLCSGCFKKQRRTASIETRLWIKPYHIFGTQGSSLRKLLATSFLKHPLKILRAGCKGGNITFLVILGSQNTSSLVACFLSSRIAHGTWFLNICSRTIWGIGHSSQIVTDR